MHPRLAVSLLLLVLLAAPATAQEQPPRKLSRALLDQSLALGQRFLVANQLPSGRFVYAFDYRTGARSKGESIVRQAGSLWGLVLTHQARPDPRAAKAIEKGLAHFLGRTQLVAGKRFLVDAEDGRLGSTGAVALLGLALIDRLRCTDVTAKDRQRLRARLDEILAFLLSVRTRRGQFHSAYTSAGAGARRPSPYYDGEALLCLARAARYMGRADLREAVIRSAERMHRVHVVAARKQDPDSSTTKGFYQWGTMSYFELATSGWKKTGHFAQRAIELAHWMIDTHHVLRRTRNTAYAFEGLACAWELARRIKDRASQRKLGRAIDQGLHKLTGWQVGGPIPNAYLRKHLPGNRRAIGGVLNHAQEPLLRIDVTQHQMHAVILARRFIYKGKKKSR